MPNKISGEGYHSLYVNAPIVTMRSTPPLRGYPSAAFTSNAMAGKNMPIPLA
jgi:hypothetical protein